MEKFRPSNCQWVDPPDGWKYGFPKRFTFSPSHPNLPGKEYEEELKDWFRYEGYPNKLIEQGMLNHCRFWEDTIV